jgi:hypothetical protein
LTVVREFRVDTGNVPLRVAEPLAEPLFVHAVATPLLVVKDAPSAASNQYLRLLIFVGVNEVGRKYVLVIVDVTMEDRPGTLATTLA